jgi:nucleotide-binding universal stress UspA family protein
VYKRILVPLDGSELAEGVLSHAAGLARRFKSEVVLLQVVQPLSKVVAETVPTAMEPSGAAAVMSVRAAEEKYQRDRQEAMAYLRTVKGRLRGVRTSLEVIDGTPGEAIVAYAQKRGADIIAMSTHGRRGLSRLVYGSVADHVLRHSITPLLLVRVLKHEA